MAHRPQHHSGVNRVGSKGNNMADESDSRLPGIPPKLNLQKAVSPKEAFASEPAAAAKPAPAAKPAAAPSMKDSGTTARISVTPGVAKPVVKPAAPSPAKAPAVAKPAIVKLAAPSPAKAPAAAKPVAAKPAAPNREDSSSTMRISLSDVDTAPAVAAAAQAKKKETSKVPLEAALAEPKPAVGTIKLSKPTAESMNEKRKTSRISLQAALGPQVADGAVATKGPKTIKLKRPSEASTVRVPTRDEGAALGDDLAKTAELDDAAVQDTQTPTRRKTIRVKRPTSRPSVGGGGGEQTVIKKGAAGKKSLSVAKKGSAKSGAQGAAAAVPAGPVDKCNWFWPVTAIASMLVIFTVIYMFCAQTFGHNQISLTQYSYWEEGPDLQWPNKIQPSATFAQEE